MENLCIGKSSHEIELIIPTPEKVPCDQERGKAIKTGYKKYTALSSAKKNFAIFRKKLVIRPKYTCYKKKPLRSSSRKIVVFPVPKAKMYWHEKADVFPSCYWHFLLVQIMEINRFNDKTMYPVVSIATFWIVLSSEN